MDIRKLQGLGLRQSLRAIFRKFIYRRVEMGYYEVLEQDMQHVITSGIACVFPDHRTLSLDDLGNPFLNVDELLEMQREGSARCIIASKDGKPLGSNWFRTGRIWIEELGRFVTLPDGIYLSCRTHVSPEARGQRILAHMLTSFAKETPDFKGFGGLIFDWNQASIKGVEKIGMTRKATYQSRWIFGIQRTRRIPEQGI